MRPRSLFWTFAGVFLAVLAVATVLQVVMSAGILRPLARQDARESAVATMDQVAPALAALDDARVVQDVIPILRAHPLADASNVLAFSITGGPVVPDRRLPPDAHRGVVVALAREGLADSALADRPLDFTPAREGTDPDAPPGEEPTQRNVPPERARRHREVSGERDRIAPPTDDDLFFPPPSDGQGPPDGGPPPFAREGRRPPRGFPPPDGPDNPRGPQDARAFPPPRPGGRARPPRRAIADSLAALGLAPRPPDTSSLSPPPQRFQKSPNARRTVRDGRGVSLDTPQPVADGPTQPVGDLWKRHDGAQPSYELLAHRPLVRAGHVIGQLAVVGPADRAVPWGLPRSRPALLLLPLAVLAAAGAGLIMVRILVNRLRALEAAADRVIGGDLRARVESQGRDEIGRLEERFNRMTDRLAAARDRVHENDQQRRRLLADITHELATPLTSIRGYVETLLDPAVETTAEERHAYLRDVRDEARRLDDMIGELFELARLEAGATPLKPVRLDWAALCGNLARRLEPRFREAGLTLAWEGSAQAAWVRADGRRLEQVVENLLVNALRYVPRGGHVWMSLAAGAEPGAHRLTVADDGPGIAPSDLPHVFERFYRAEAVRAMGGTGLGLAIVAEIVRQHGGGVHAERREPRGAMFVVELAAERA